MLDFTSALYLGLRHPSGSLGDWEALTLGRPAALREPPDAEAVAAELAELQGCEAGALLPSTLHLFWDLFALLATRNVVILRDAGAYPIARWGTERAQGDGHAGADRSRITTRHRSREWRRTRRGRGCRRSSSPTATARAAAARRQSRVCRHRRTQRRASRARRHTGARDPRREAGRRTAVRPRRRRIAALAPGTFGRHIVTGSSLAKGFGVPVAVLAGDRDARSSGSGARARRGVHCSPPSVAVIRAARRALAANRSHGEALRLRLLHLVSRLRARLIDAGLTSASQLPFPVQTFESASPHAATLHEQLLRAGVVGLLTMGCRTLTAGLTLLVTARHSVAEIERAARAIAYAARAAVARLDSGVVIERALPSPGIG